jgi:hypothetical protein
LEVRKSGWYTCFGRQKLKGQVVVMPNPEDLIRLNRHVLFTSLVSLGVTVFGLIGLTLYFEPSWVGVESVSRGMYQGEIGRLVLGMVLACAGITFLFISNQWSSQLKRIVLNTSPVKMTIKLELKEDSDSRTYYAVINRRSADAGEPPAWRAHIWVYPPKIMEDVGQEFEGEVFIRPETGLPVAIEYSKGVLWVISGNGAVKRLPAQVC